LTVVKAAGLFSQQSSYFKVVHCRIAAGSQHASSLAQQFAMTTRFFYEDMESLQDVVGPIHDRLNVVNDGKRLRQLLSFNAFRKP
jgi:hypothetical protein